MRIGDLVKHKRNGSYGTVMEIRTTKDAMPAFALVYSPTISSYTVYSLRMLEVINENEV